MTYSEIGYAYLLARMLERADEFDSNLDQREGSLIFNGLAPAAFEMSMLSTEIVNAISESFAMTASREYLLIACEDRGIDISIFEATYGVFRGEFDVEVEIGSRWNCDLYNYTVISFIEETDGIYAYRLQCETAGSAPNTVTGNLTAISDFPAGLSSAKIVECITEGKEESTDEEIRETYKKYLTTASDGNVAQYCQWCESYPGIGGYKIFPLWNGPNTVKVSILSESGGVASDTLIEDFQNYLDPGITGMGDGVAPIGAFVTVTTATVITIDVQATVIFTQTADTSLLDEAIQNYMTSISYDKDTVSHFGAAAAIMAVDGVETITEFLLNGDWKDIELGDEEIPQVGATEWTVVYK